MYVGVIAKYFLQIGLNVKFLGELFFEEYLIIFGLSLIKKVNQMKTRQHSTTLDNTRQHSTTLDNTRQHSTTLDNTRQHSTTLD
jgi:hypothetical protein